jgi:MFS family permease
VAPPVARDPGFWSVLSAPAIWLIALCFAPLLAANSGMVVQIYEHARDLGLERAEAGLAVTSMAVGGAVGKPIYGRVADFIGPRRALLFAIGLMVLGLALFLAATGLPSLMVAGAVFGFGFSGLVVLQAVLAAEIFGREVLGRVLGVIGWGILPLVFFVNPFLGWIHESTGSYALAFQILMAGCGLSALLLALIPKAQSAAEASSSPA